jgi:hypothetical protein
MQQLPKKDLIKYLSSIGQEFSSKIDRIYHLIGDEHHPSSGRYRERILILGQFKSEVQHLEVFA